MLSDRPYMRSGPDPRRQIPMVGWLLIVNAGVFLLQNLLQLFFGMDGLLRSAATGRPGGGFLGQWFVLSIDNLANGKVWTLLTYSLLHGSLFHLLANFLLLFFVGRMVEQLVGRQGLLRLYLLAVLGGGLLWSLVHLGDPRAMVIGASGGAIGFLIYFCLKRPNEPITLLLFFVLPVTVLPKWVGWAVLAIGVFGLAFSELGPQADGIAHSAHLGGMAGAFLFWRYESWFRNLSLPRIRSSKGSRGKGASSTPSRRPRYRVNLETVGTGKKGGGSTASGTGRPPPEEEMDTESSDFRHEVDRILDKINASGFGSLTEEERTTLHKARSLLRK